MRLPIKRLTGDHYVVLGIFAIIGIIFLRVLYQWEPIPFKFTEFLFFRGEWWEWFVTGSPVLIGGILLNVYKLAKSTNPPDVHETAADIPMSGFLTSLMAGILEEIVFRWALFFGLMGLFWFIDYHLFSNMFQQALAGPFRLFNLIVGMGNPEITLDPKNWAIGLAILLSNWKFQEGHSYMGLEGQIFSWLGGMMFFNILFRHGIFAAMIVHFSFDMLTFIMLLIDIMIEQANGVYKPTRKIYQWY